MAAKRKIQIGEIHILDKGAWECKVRIDRRRRRDPNQDPYGSKCFVATDIDTGEEFRINNTQLRSE